MEWCLLFYLLLLWLSCGGCAEILEFEPLHSQTIPVNSTTVFTCTTAGELVWEVNGTQLQEGSAITNRFAMRGVRITNKSSTSEQSRSTLLVEGAKENNGTQVRCLARDFDGLFIAAESDAVTIHLFDPPMSPPLSKSPVAPLTLNLSWDAPWSLPGVEITYRVKITNLNTSQESESEELRTTYYMFSGEEENHMYICDTYKFSVRARNDAGESDQSGIIISSLPTIPNVTHSMQSLTNSVMFNDGNVSVRITFEHTEFCEDYPVQYYSVRLGNSETQEVIWAGPYFPSGDGVMEIHLDSSDGIRENVQYLFNIVATNEVGNGTSEENDFYTTDVQYAEVSLENHTVNITCTFAEGTEALGCHVELRPINSRGNPLSVNISRAPGSDEAMEVIPTSLPAVCYDVLVRDWEADGTHGELNVPVDVTPTEEGSRNLCFEPTGGGGNSTGNASTMDTSTTPTSGQATPNSDHSVIIGASIGSVAFVVLAIVVVIISIIVISREKKKQSLQSDGAMYDEVGPPELPPRKSAEVAMELNIAYASNIQVEPNDAYSGTVTGSTDAEDYYVNEGLGPSSNTNL